MSVNEINKGNYQKTGKGFEIGNLQNKLLTTATSIFLAVSAASCDAQPWVGSWNNTARWDYEKGKTGLFIESTEEKQKILINAYNKYFDTYERYQQDFVALQAEGDTRGAKNVHDKMKDLENTIKKTEKKIDKEGDKLLDLQEYLMRGKQKSAMNEVKKKNKNNNKKSEVLTRRTFKEYHQ